MIWALHFFMSNQKVLNLESDEKHDALSLIAREPEESDEPPALGKAMAGKLQNREGLV